PVSMCWCRLFIQRVSRARSRVPVVVTGRFSAPCRHGGGFRGLCGPWRKKASVSRKMGEGSTITGCFGKGRAAFGVRFVSHVIFFPGQGVLSWRKLWTMPALGCCSVARSPLGGLAPLRGGCQLFDAGVCLR